MSVRSSTSPEVPAWVQEGLEEIKPRLRGWLHAATAPLAFVAFLLALVVAERMVVRAGVAVFMVSALALFSCSALYHTRTWAAGPYAWWRRIDHATIYLLIAGSYTPYCLLLLDRGEAVAMLALVWGGALLGMLFRLLWIDAPRWLYVSLYVLVGCSALASWEGLVAGAPPATTTLLVLGGASYVLGALVYGFRRPDPWPRWFGYHEVFHALTILAFACHYAGVGVLAQQRA